MINVNDFDSINESKYYTKLRVGLIRYTGQFDEIEYDDDLTQQFPKLLNVIQSLHITDAMRAAVLHLWKMNWIKVYTMPAQLFILLRRDMIFTYPDHYNLHIEGVEVRDTVTRIDNATGIMQIIVPDTTTTLIDGKISRIYSRQLHHELGHFIYEDIKNTYYVKNRLMFGFYKKLFFESEMFIGGNVDANKNRWLYIIKRFLTFTNKLNKIEKESLSLINVRIFENRIKVLFNSFDGFITDELDIDYISYLDSVLRKIIPTDEVAFNIVSDVLRGIYKDIWLGSWSGARIHKKNKFYQELFYPSEVFARILEGAGRNNSNRMYEQLAASALIAYPNREEYLITDTPTP